jgi:glyoxylase-like metal-dependent hydrolase (beta-lactamase superfamily II)
VPGILVKTFRGHTASMQGIIVRSRAENPHFSQKQGEVGHPPDSYAPTACYISDLIPTTAHIDLTWGMGFDLYPLDTIESKKEYYARALPEKWLTVFTHDPNVPWAYIEKDESGKMVAKETE